jgi:hypothetical protein
MNLRETWERIGLRPWKLALLLLGFATVLVVSPLVARVYSSVLGCSGEEQEVFAEFVQYGGREMEPQPSLESGSCAVFYDTPASQERVANYYTERLEARGWEVEQREYETTVSGPKKRTFDEVEIMARRGDFFYEVFFESHRYYDPPRPGVHVAVHVSKNENAPPPCGSKEKAALAEFSHYRGKKVEDLGTFSLRGKPKGFCVTTYLAEGASEEQVLSYYEKKLTKHGYKVQRFPTDRGGRIEASRDGLRYVVKYSRFPEEHATDIRVEVY